MERERESDFFDERALYLFFYFETPIVQSIISFERRGVETDGGLQWYGAYWNPF